VKIPQYNVPEAAEILQKVLYTAKFVKRAVVYSMMMLLQNDFLRNTVQTYFSQCPKTRHSYFFVYLAEPPFELSLRYKMKTKGGLQI